MDASDRDYMVRTHLPLVHRLCKRFVRSGELFDDLVQVGTIGLLKAIQKYDPNRGTEFKTYAIPTIVGEIKNYFRDHAWAGRVPRNLQRRKRLVNSVIERLTQELGRSPVVQDIVAATGLSEEEVHETFELSTFAKPLSLEALDDRYGTEEASSWRHYHTTEAPQADHLIQKVDLVNAIRELKARESSVILLRFFLGMPQTKVAERLGISQMQVSRLQRAALRKLRVDLNQGYGSRQKPIKPLRR